MARTPKKAAASAGPLKAASAIAAAPRSGVGTEGDAGASSGSGASAATSTPPTGAEAASVASTASADQSGPVPGAQAPAAAAMDRPIDAVRDWQAVFVDLIEESRLAYVAQAQALERLFDHAMAGPSGAAARTLMALSDARAELKVTPAELIARLENRAKDDRADDRDDLVELSVRSRDGKPFRRAGLVLGDAYQDVLVTPAQAKILRADRVGVQIKATRGEG